MDQRLKPLKKLLSWWVSLVSAFIESTQSGLSSRNVAASISHILPRTPRHVQGEAGLNQPPLFLRLSTFIDGFAAYDLGILKA
jgi:hypothetical protein